MALSKKQFKKLKKAMTKGGKSLDPERRDSPPSAGKSSKGGVSGNKEYVQKLNDKSHFGDDCSYEDEEDDTYKDDNDSYINGDDEADDDDFFDGNGSAGKLSMDSVALSGSVLDAVRNARMVTIDNLFTKGNITGHARAQLIERYVNGEGIAFSHTHDDGFNDLVKLLDGNGKVLNTGKTGPQTAGKALVELSKGGIDAVENPLIADAQRRADGKNNL